MILPLRYLPPFLGVIGAIAGVSLTSALIAPSSKAWNDYTNSVLTVERLKTIKYFQVGTMQESDQGVIVMITPQSTKAIHSQFGPPTSFLKDRDIYMVRGANDGSLASQKVVFMYNDLTGEREAKATYAVISPELVKAK